jgi:hypothetical protein
LGGFCGMLGLPLFEKVDAMKNPFMSMFLSGANKVAGSARGHATAAIKRETAKNMSQMTRLWTDALLPGAAAPRKRTSRRK